MLTVEGTYTSGDREGITVSHEIDFGTMQIKRNYLYKVRIALEDPAGDTYGKVTHAINVKDWTSGVTLAWAGDENLYNNLAAANFTVTGTERKLRDATLSDPEQHLVLPYNAEKSATFYVTSTSTKSGLSLTCPATAVAATAEEGGGYQCTITPQASTYSENGEFTQKWQVTVRESAMLAGNILTFTLQNALNSALSTSFEVIGAPFRNSTSDIQAGDVYYANGLWSRPADMEDCITYTGTTATGIVAPMAAYESADGDVMLGTDYCGKPYSKIEAGDVYFNKGYWVPGNTSMIATCDAIADNDPIGVVFKVGTSSYDTAAGFSHAYVIAPKESVHDCDWAPSGSTYLTTQATDVLLNENYDKTEAQLRIDVLGDLDGYKHCQTAKGKVTNFTTDNFIAMYHAANYENTVNAPTLTSGWYLPSIGQWYEFNKFAGLGEPAFFTSQKGFYYTSNNATQAVEVMNAVFSTRGLSYDTFLNDSYQIWSSSERDATIAYHLHLNGSNLHIHNNSSWTKSACASYVMAVRAVLAF